MPVGQPVRRGSGDLRSLNARDVPGIPFVSIFRDHRRLPATEHDTERPAQCGLRRFWLHEGSISMDSADTKREDCIRQTR